MLKRIIFILSIILLFNCKPAYVSKKITKKLHTNFYNNQFTGLLVYNPRTKDTIINYNATKYFTPASNTKIFTLFTALQVLPDSIPSFKYQIDSDTISIQGTGDPSFLHSYFKDSTVLKMVKNYKKVNLILGNLIDQKFGSGWAWEDYDTSFSVERSSFPMYGNVVTITNNDSLQSIPKILHKNIHLSKRRFTRAYYKNEFFYHSKKNDTLKVPMLIDSILISKLWNDLLPNKVHISKNRPKEMKTVYSIHSDSLYKRMMYKSDNFLAEQLLVLASSTLSDTLNTGNIRAYILNNQLKDLKQSPRWVDGSGLSRYNLFSPASFVQVLTKLYDSIPKKRLFNFFPVGGKSGTLKEEYAGYSKLYIYAKSGSLRNNYSLSGYLITNKGETLIFSFMNNHYQKPTSEVKKQMQFVFEYLRNKY